MADELRDFLLPVLDVEDPVVIRMRHEPEAASARLLVSLGAGWIVDEDAPVPRAARSVGGKLPYGSVTPERLQLAEQAQALREQGLGYLQIAARLGVSRSYASDLCLDSDGSQARARKDSYRQPCPNCDTPMTGSNGLTGAPLLCASCAAIANHEERHWTAETITGAFQEFAHRFGRTPAAIDSMGLPPSMSEKFSPARQAEILEAKQADLLPAPAIVQREFGSWAAALEAAGLPRNTGGAPAHRSRRKLGSAQQATLDLLASGPMRISALTDARYVRVETVRQCLTTLVARGLVGRVSRGVYALADHEPDSSREGAESQSSERGRARLHDDGARDDQQPEMRAPTPAATDNGSGGPESAPGPKAAGDGFPDDTKDAYAVALVAALRAFADTLEAELALT